MKHDFRNDNRDRKTFQSLLGSYREQDQLHSALGLQICWSSLFNGIITFMLHCCLFTVTRLKLAKPQKQKKTKQVTCSNCSISCRHNKLVDKLYSRGLYIICFHKFSDVGKSTKSSLLILFQHIPGLITYLSPSIIFCPFRRWRVMQVSEVGTEKVPRGIHFFIIPLSALFRLIKLLLFLLIPIIYSH